MKMNGLRRGELIMYKNDGDSDYRIGEFVARGQDEGGEDLIMVKDPGKDETHQIQIKNVKLSFPVGQPVYFIDPTDRIPTTRIGTIASTIAPYTVGEKTIYVYTVKEQGGGEPKNIPFEYVKLSSTDLTSWSETAANAFRYQGIPFFVESALGAGAAGPPGMALAAAKPFSAIGTMKARQNIDNSINSQITNILEKFPLIDNRFKEIEGRCAKLEEIVIEIWEEFMRGMDATGGVAGGGGRKKKCKSKKSKSKKKKSHRRKTKRRS